jgi:hypothetical protein
MKSASSGNFHMKAITVAALAVAFSVACCDAGSAADIQSPARVPILVELFTSEGCSSCPPADALLQQMDEAPPSAAAQLIVLSEHVDYWDHDGWKDPYSSAQLTDRQSGYVRELGLNSAYTPQFIVDGVRELKVTDALRMKLAFEQAAETPKIPVTLSAISFDPNSSAVLRAHLDANGESLKHNADVYVAVALNHAESKVLKGENSGRRLTHVAVVLELQKIGKLEKAHTFSQDLQLKLPAGADPHNLRIIAFVQEPGSGKVVGAAAGEKVN